MKSVGGLLIAALTLLPRLALANLGFDGQHKYRVVEERIVPSAIEYLTEVLHRTPYSDKEKVSSILELIHEERILTGEQPYEVCRSENKSNEEPTNMKAFMKKRKVPNRYGRMVEEELGHIKLCRGFYERYASVSGFDELKVSEAIASAARDLLFEISHHYGHRSYPKKGDVGSWEFVQQVFAAEGSQKDIRMLARELQPGYYLPHSEPHSPCALKVMVTPRGVLLALVENPRGRMKCMAKEFNEERRSRFSRYEISRTILFRYENASVEGELCYKKWGRFCTPPESDRQSGTEFADFYYLRFGIVDRSTVTLKLSEHPYLYEFVGEELPSPQGFVRH